MGRWCEGFSFSPYRHHPPLLLPPFCFYRSPTPLPSLPQQSLNDKRKKNLFSRKFPFYKNKDASEQETSDVDRKYKRERAMCHWEGAVCLKDHRSATGGKASEASTPDAPVGIATGPGYTNQCN